MQWVANAGRKLVRPVVRLFVAGVFAGIGLSSAAAQDQPPAPKDPPEAKGASNPPAAANPSAPGSSEGPPATPADDATKYPEIMQAVELFRQLKFNEARQKLEDAVKAHPELAPAPLIYAELLIKAGQVAQGRKEIEDVVTKIPGDPRVYMAIGAIGLAEGRWTDALWEYEKATEAAQTFAFVNEEEKSKFLAKCSLGRGTVYENRKEWSKAKVEFEQWLKLEPKNGVARQRLARAIFFEGDVDRALAELKQAKADDPKLSPAESALGSFYATKNEFEKAEENYRKGVESEPTSLLAHQTYAQWLFTRGRTKDAKDETMSALKVMPTNKTLRLMRAIFARHLKAYDEAETELEDLLRENANDIVIRNELALTLAEQPDPVKNRRAFELSAQNAKANQRSADLLATYGWVNYKLGNLDQAEKVLRVALQMSAQQTRPELFYYLAHVLAEKGSNADVKKLLEQVVNTEVPFAFKDDAKQWLQRLNASEAGANP